jgi:hypothetical protein
MRVQLTRLAHVNKFRFALLALLALVLNSVPLFNQNAAFAQGKGVGKDDPHGLAICPLQFEAMVHQGTNAEKFSLTGVLDLKAEGTNGALDGALVLDTGFRLPLHGQLNGRAVNFILDLGDDVSVNGVGTVLTSRGEHGCLILDGGGVFVGPNRDDVGSWLTSFFPPSGSGGSGTTTSTPPIIKNPTFNDRGRIEMQIAGSFIQPGATLTITAPFSTVTYGPFSLQGDVTGTLLIGVYDANTVQPINTCRFFTVTNPDGTKSSAVTLCRG